MRKSVPILCLFLLQVMVGSAPAIDITIPDASAPAGKSITVALQTTDMTGKGIYSLDFTVIFNGSVLSVTNVLSSGTLLSTWGAPTFNSSNGQVRVSSGGTAPLTGTGNFVKIVFQVAANAAAGTSSPMAFSAFTFNDGSPIPQLYNGTFTVVQDNEPPVFTSDPQAESVTVHSATITWRTDEPATSVVQWGETPSYGQVTRSDELVTVHSVTLTGLRAGRTFNFRAGGSDKHGNGPSWSAGNEFTTPDIVVSLPDAALDPGTMVTIPVRVSDVSGQDITSINMTVQYNRDILTANGVLSEGTMVDNWPSPLFSVSAGQVSVDLSGSTALTGSGILVKLQMQVKNSVPIGRRTALHFADLQLNSGDVPVVARDGQFTVRDTRAPVITGGPQADQITATGAKIIWTTDEKATSKVEFGKDESYGFTEYSYLRTTDHSITLSGLEPETVYYYRVSSTDSSGNGPVKSGNFTFLTAAGGNIVIDLADLSANVGSTVIVPVTTTDISGQGVTSLYAVIGYDRQLLQFERVTTNNSLSAAWQNLLYDSIDGLVTVQNRGNEPLSNSGTLFFCHFRILSNIYNGRTELRFNRFLYNQGWPQVTVRNGELEITGRPDVRPPEFIQTPFVDRIMEFSARIFWTTALPTIGEVSYGQTAAFGKFLYSSEPATVHSVLINDLEPGMDWSYRVKITNPVNSLSTLSDNLSFHTPAGTPVSVSLPDVVQPAGSAFSMAVETGNLTGLNVYSAYLVLRYDQRYLSVTDVSSSSTISSGWGTPVFTITPGRVVITMGGVTPLKNSGKLVELAFRLAENAPQDEKFPVWFESCFYNEGEPETSPSSGLVTVQDIFSPSITQGPQVFALTPNSATLLWATDEPATSQVEYGTSPGFGDVKSSFQLNTGHLLVLSNLQPNTLYYYQISSQDVSGNGPVNSSVETFITPGLQFLTLSVSDQIAPPSADISIPVRVSDVTAASVLSIGFDLVFDPNIIEITGADVDGCFTQNWGQISFEKKNGRVFVLLKGSSVLTGSGILANIRARVNAGATIGAVSPLTLSNVLINGINVPANLQNGVLTVGDSDPPQIVSGPYTGSITAYSAEIIWYTDEPANSTVAFGTTPALGQEKTLQKLTREHKVVLDNLLPDTRIYYKTGSSDQFRNGPTWSELQNFTTLNAQDIRLFLPDTTADPGDELTLPLRISGVTGREIMACSLRILLDEDITALSTETSGTLIAGWNAPLMQMQGNVVAFTLSGDQPLTGAGDLLRMRVKISENTIPGSSLSLFFLQATFNNSDLPVQLNNGRIKINDTSPPKITNGPLVRNITATTAVIAWSTDEASTSRVEYGTTQQYGFERSGSGLVREHEIKLSGLQPNTTYHYRVSSTDSVQNGPTTSSDAVFMTVSDTAVRVSLQDSSALPDETLLLPVRLGDMPGTITKFQCMILYDPLNLTIEGVTQQNTLTQNWPDFILTPGDGQIFISAEGGTVSESGILFNLQISISSGAQPGQTAIDFDQFIFNDGVPQAQASGCRINIIDNLPPVIVYGPAATAITTTSATIVWQTDEAANSMVEYGRTLNLGLSKTDTRLITDHEITLRDLVPSTLYYYRGNSTDARGNGPTQSQVLSFKTANISGIYLALPETLAAAGEIDIPVQMKNMSGTALQSAELEIESDPEIVTFKGVLTDNSESADWPDPVVNISSGKININLSGPPVLATEGIFIFIRCQIAADAGIGEKAPLIFSKTICNNGDIPVTAKNGRIVIKDNTLPQFVVSPKVTEIFYNGATLAWETDEITTGYAEYGTTPQFGTFVDDPKLSLQHQISITGLQPTTRYYYKVGIVDSSGNGPVVSPAGAFTTREETLYISSPDTSASAGSVILWPIFISFTGGYQIRKVEISVTYDPQVLTASGAQQNGTIAEDWPQPLFSDSRGELKITMSGTKALQGEGVLIYVGFQVSPGAPVETRTELLISRVVLNDGTPLPTGITSGSITILQGNVEEQVTVSIPDTSAVSDFSLLLPVMVSDLSGFKIYSFTTTLEFDPEVMQVFGIDTSGCLISHWPLPFFNLSGNSIQIDASGVTAPAGSGVLFYLKIRTLPRLISGTTGRIKFLNFSFNDYYPGVKPTDGSVFLLARYDVIWGYAEDESAKTPVDSVLVVAEPGGLEYLTEPDGYFEFTELDTSVGFTLAAFKNGYVSTPVEGVQAGGENIKIYLQRNDGYIDGKVRDKNNKIVIGALVIANNNAGSFGSANTDSSGYFRITGLAKSSLYTVRASKYGFYDRVVENVAVNTTMDIRLDFQFGTVTGQLTFIDGKPNRIAQMVLDDIIDPDISFKTEVKDDGTYQFQQIPAGEYILKVFLPGYVSEPGQMQFTLPPAGSFQADFSLEKAVLYRIVIQGKTEIPNNEPAAYEAVALTENDRQMSIEEPLWLLSPEKAGTPDSLRNGLLIPNPSYFGHTVLVAVDISSGITDTLDIDIYAPVDKNTHAVYENDAGITLSVLPGCFSGQQKLKIQTVELPPFKKNAKSATAHGNGYWLKPDGLALDQPVLLSFPFQNSKNNSRITIGLWDKQDAQWAFQQKVPAEADMVSSTVSSLGLYAVLVKSRPLGIEQIKYLPNPFSPDIDTDNDGYTGLSIHLKVTSLSSRTPFVTITVYSMLGIRLRDIAVRQPLIKDNDNIVHWDGRTDDGLLARNGRYIIRTTVEDASGTEEHVGTVVLVR